MNFIKCYTCGKLFPDEQAIENSFCSYECMEEYRCCLACGKYFAVKERGDDLCCSDECHEAYYKSEDEVL